MGEGELGFYLRAIAIVVAWQVGRRARNVQQLMLTLSPFLLRFDLLQF